MDTFATLHIRGHVGTIRVDRPPVNAINPHLAEQVADAAVQAADDSNVRAVVVYGGDHVFSAGADIKEMAEWSYADAAEKVVTLQSAATNIAKIPKPTVAAIHGYALGAGLALALACDHRVVADSTELGMPEIGLGIISGAGGTQRLARLVGPARAKDLMYTGRRVPATEALTMGLVDRVVSSDEVNDTAYAWASQFATGPACALRAAKFAVDRGLETDMETGLELERQLFAGLFGTSDQKEGMRSFIHNGPGHANFEGR